MSKLQRAMKLKSSIVGLGVMLLLSAGPVMADGGHRHGHGRSDCHDARHYNKHYGKHHDRYDRRDRRHYHGHKSYYRGDYARRPATYVVSVQQPIYAGGSPYNSGYYRSTPNFGNAVGGALGGYLGSQIGSGSGQLAATAAGAVIGYSIGGHYQ
jgi:hypothetical protein